MKKTIITALALLSLGTAYAANKPQGIQVVDLRTERMTAPMSIDTPTPRLGWRIETDKNDVAQKSYRIIVA